MVCGSFQAAGAACSGVCEGSAHSGPHGRSSQQSHNATVRKVSVVLSVGENSLADVAEEKSDLVFFLQRLWAEKQLMETEMWCVVLRACDKWKLDPVKGAGELRREKQANREN